jgi:hypothetical protein
VDAATKAWSDKFFTDNAGKLSDSQIASFVSQVQAKDPAWMIDNVGYQQLSNRLTNRSSAVNYLRGSGNFAQYKANYPGSGFTPHRPFVGIALALSSVVPVIGGVVSTAAKAGIAAGEAVTPQPISATPVSAPSDSAPPSSTPAAPGVQGAPGPVPGWMKVAALIAIVGIGFLVLA